ncbi:MAG: nitroreductase family protein [Bilifractor sp.]
MKVKVGYYGEELVLRMTELGLGTCWVGGTYDNHSVSVQDGETLVLVFGNIEASVKDRVIRSLARSKNRKDISERIDSDTAVFPSFITNGMETVKLAPSAVNRQNPTIHLKNGVITMSVDLGARFDLVDLGIAMKHFEIGAENGKFELKNEGLFIVSR